ncbi:MAG: FAD-binding oxidoreductase [Acidobacteriia bacterium]|nr:FAD-binding oxidoreductase [Terriglobia bacterium]
MSSASPAAALGAELAAIVGDAHVLDQEAAVCAAAIDGVLPAAVASPGSAEEIAAVLRLASARQWTVVPVGALHEQAVGFTPERVDVVLSTRRLNAIDHYDPADLTIGVGAGAKLGDVFRAVGERRQILPIDPPHADERTVGGVMAAASSGPLKHGYGGVREFCIGVKFVTGDGKVGRGGGRVVKNVAGYDLMKLMIGSWGTLGVIVGASFKVFPRPRQTRTFVLDFLLSGGAVQFRDRLMRSPLPFLAVDLLSPRASEYVAGMQSQNWRLLLRAAGSDAVLARYRTELGHYIVGDFDGADEEKLWLAVSDFPESVLARHRNAMLMNINVPPESLGVVVSSAERAGIENNFLPAVMGRGGIGSLVVAFIPIAVDPPAAVQYVNAASAFRSGLTADSSAAVVRCPREAKRHFHVWGDTPTDLSMMRTIKQALDPAGVLNRGRFLL